MRTNDGWMLGPNGLAKVRELAVRTRDVIESLGTRAAGYKRRYERESLVIESRSVEFVLGAELLLTDQHGLIIYQELKGEPAYVHRQLMDDALESLRRWQVLDDLAEL